MSSKLVRVLRLCQTISFFFLLNLVAVSAQTITPNIKLVSPAGTSVQPSSAPTANGLETERIRTLEETLRQQNEKIDQMLKLIQRQQQMIDSLDARTARGNANPSNASAVADPASRTRESSESAPVDPSVRTVETSEKTLSAGTPGTTTQTQQPSLEDRVKQIEERVTKIGPIRFGGDFRLRFDGTFRPATEPPDPSLQHAQNARMRYRLRLNLDTDLNKFVSFHGQLSTGQIGRASCRERV